VSLASRGLRNINDVEEKIENDAELAQVRRQARRVYLKSVTAAIVITLLVLFIPR
jgi:hypothetical protein